MKTEQLNWPIGEFKTTDFAVLNSLPILQARNQVSRALKSNLLKIVRSERTGKRGNRENILVKA